MKNKRFRSSIIFSYVILFTTITTVAFAEDSQSSGVSEGNTVKLSFQEAYEKALRISPALMEARAKITGAKARQKQTELILPSNPHLSLIYGDGTFSQGANFSGATTDLLSAGDAKTHSYEVELRQEIPVTGEQSNRRKAAKTDVAITEERLRIERLNLKNNLRILYYRRSALNEMNEELEHHIEHLGVIRRRLGANYRDPSLGDYARTAFFADLSAIQLHKSQIESEFRRADIRLKSFIGLNANQLLDTDSLDDSSFPKLPPADTLTTLMMKNHPEYRLAKLQRRRAADEREVQESRRYSNPSLFIQGGEAVQRNSSTAPTVGGPSSERERYVRAGITFSLPVVDNNESGILEAKAMEKAGDARIDMLERTLHASLDEAMVRYTKSIGQIRQLTSAMQKLETHHHRLSQAFVQGRLTYLEFWSEHERWHSTLELYHANNLEALEARAALEYLIGQDLNDVSK